MLVYDLCYRNHVLIPVMSAGLSSGISRGLFSTKMRIIGVRRGAVLYRWTLTAHGLKPLLVHNEFVFEKTEEPFPVFCALAFPYVLQINPERVINL